MSTIIELKQLDGGGEIGRARGLLAALICVGRRTKFLRRQFAEGGRQWRLVPDRLWHSSARIDRDPLRPQQC